MSRPLSIVGAGTDIPLCTFPLSRDKTCPEPAVRTGKPGQQPAFCANPEHNTAAKYRRKQKWLREDEEKKAANTLQTSAERPITDSSARLTATLAEFVRVAGEVGAVMEDARALAATLVDQEAVEREIAAVRRDADIRVAHAQSAQAEAERRAHELATERDRAMDLVKDASDTADEAVHLQREAEEKAAAAIAAKEDLEDRTAEALRELRAERDAAVKAKQTAEADLEAAKKRIDQMQAQQLAALTEVQARADEAAREVRQQHAQEFGALRAELVELRKRAR